MTAGIVALGKVLGLREGELPFPWQEELLRRFLDGAIPPALDIPTGLGKTSVMAIWLLARAAGAAVPRRLVYVVDRRAVVDQATEEAERLRNRVEGHPRLKAALGIEPGRALRISTLRGQYVDNREWLADPSSPAVVVGTVDMVGSRLLFEGYGISRKMRPFHAGLLGVDVLVVLDESHLVPPFEALVRAIERESERFGPGDPALRGILPPFRLLSLSATGRSGASGADGDGALRLSAEDLDHPVVRKRVLATKRLRILHVQDRKDRVEALAEEAWRLTGDGTLPVRCIVFCGSREEARKAYELIGRWKKGNRREGIAPVDVETDLFVGGRRVFEREAAAARLAELGFLPEGGERIDRAVILFATSAAEVGVDLDADHLVCDLVAWERMVQRLGRVNRRGNGKAQVLVVLEPVREPSAAERKAMDTAPYDRSKGQEKAIAAYERETVFDRACRRVIQLLLDGGERADVSLQGLAEAKKRPEVAKAMEAATTPEPLRPALTRPLVDAWALTSLEEHPGRPEVQPWLRGWVEEEPQSSVCWRRHLPVDLRGDGLSEKAVAFFFDAAAPEMVERLETETHRVVSWVMKRAEAVVSLKKGKGSRIGDPERRAISDLVEDGGDLDEGGTAPARPEADSSSGDPHSALDRVVAFTLTASGTPEQSWSLVEFLDDEAFDGARKGIRPMDVHRLQGLRRRKAFGPRGKQKELLHRLVAGRTLIVDARFGGLGQSGLLDEGADGPALALDVEREPDDPTGPERPGNERRPAIPFRVRIVSGAGEPPEEARWIEQARFRVDGKEEGDATFLAVEGWRDAAPGEEGRATSSRPQLLDEHQAWTVREARRIAGALDLPEDYARMLEIVASRHDEGKRAPNWQRAMNAPRDGRVYAKTRGPVKPALLAGYRHELGSLLHLVGPGTGVLDEFPEEPRELAQHLAISHHGHGRPLVSISGCDGAPPSQLDAVAREIALRFVRLQRRWGPWGLAWFEALLRAADQEASRLNDRKVER